MPQAPAWTLHSVMPSGPSIASTISISEIAPGVPGQSIAAVCAAEAGDEAGLREWLEQLGDRGDFQPCAFGQFGRAVDAVGPRGERGQDDGGVVGELGDPKHRGALLERRLQNGLKLYVLRRPGAKCGSERFRWCARRRTG
jgi:hypothetical protein